MPGTTPNNSNNSNNSSNFDVLVDRLIATLDAGQHEMQSHFDQRLQELARQVQAVDAGVEGLRAKLDETYVRREVHVVELAAIGHRLDALAAAHALLQSSSSRHARQLAEMDGQINQRISDAVVSALHDDAERDTRLLQLAGSVLITVVAVALTIMGQALLHGLQH